MKSADVFDAYVDRSWRFLADSQRAADKEFVVGYRFAWVKGAIGALGLTDSSALHTIPTELFRRNVLCYSVSGIARGGQVHPCLTRDTTAVNEITNALADFAVRQRRGAAATA